MSKLPSMEVLSRIVAELNDVLDPDPPICIHGHNGLYDEEEITNVLIAAGELLQDGDEISWETITSLKKLGVDIPNGVVIKGDKYKNPTMVSPQETTKSKDTIRGIHTGKTPAKKKGEPSNKLMVYQAWKNGTTDIEELHKLVKEAVQKNTIKTWVYRWKKGNNLPAGV